MDGGSWHCTGNRDPDHPYGKEMQKKKRKDKVSHKSVWEIKVDIKKARQLL